MKKLFILVIFLQACVMSNESSYENSLPKEYFDGNDNKEKVYFAGSARLLGTAKNSGGNELILHPKEWYLYEIKGYMLPEGKEMIDVIVAHQFNGALITNYSWLASLETFDDGLGDTLNADYKLVGVSLGESIYCPEASEEHLFKEYKPDFKKLDDKKSCYRI